MNTRSKIILLIINTLLCALIVVCAALFMSGWSTAVRVVCYCGAGVAAVFELVTFFIRKEALFKSGFVLVVFVAVTVALIATVSQVAHLEKYHSDAEKIEALVEFIRGLGGWGYVVFFLIQVLQVLVLPIPAVVCYVPGSIIFGAWQATLIATAGVIVGSVISYVIGKVVGKRAVVWIAGEETTKKYTDILSKRCKVLFVLMQILPFFPDDILCMLAGVTGMSFPFFITTIVLIRPIIISLYCFLGHGNIIPFSGWGIPVWIAIVVVCIVLAILSFKYQDKFEGWLVKKFSKKKKGEEDDQPQKDE